MKNHSLLVILGLYVSILTTQIHCALSKSGTKEDSEYITYYRSPEYPDLNRHLTFHKLTHKYSAHLCNAVARAFSNSIKKESSVHLALHVLWDCELISNPELARLDSKDKLITKNKMVSDFTQAIQACATVIRKEITY